MKYLALLFIAPIFASGDPRDAKESLQPSPQTLIRVDKLKKAIERRKKNPYPEAVWLDKDSRKELNEFAAIIPLMPAQTNPTEEPRAGEENAK